MYRDEPHCLQYLSSAYSCIKQKAILRANIYFLIIHRECLHDFFCIVHAFRQFMTLREAISPYSQECFEAFLATAVLSLACNQLRDGIQLRYFRTRIKRFLQRGQDQGCQNRDFESDRSSNGRIANRRIFTSRIVET